jgi:hypothetical protein
MQVRFTSSGKFSFRRVRCRLNLFNCHQSGFYRLVDQMLKGSVIPARTCSASGRILMG